MPKKAKGADNLRIVMVGHGTYSLEGGPAHYPERESEAVTRIGRNYYGIEPTSQPLSQEAKARMDKAYDEAMAIPNDAITLTDYVPKRKNRHRRATSAKLAL